MTRCKSVASTEFYPSFDASKHDQEESINDVLDNMAVREIEPSDVDIVKVGNEDFES